MTHLDDRRDRPPPASHRLHRRRGRHRAAPGLADFRRGVVDDAGGPAHARVVVGGGALPDRLRARLAEGRRRMREEPEAGYSTETVLVTALR